MPSAVSRRHVSLRAAVALCLAALAAAAQFHPSAQATNPGANGRIAFHSLISGNNWDIFVINPDGSGQTRLTESEGVDGGPDFSPDGLMIAFHTIREGNAELYVMNASGSNQVKLHDNPASSDAFPDWESVAAQPPPPPPGPYRAYVPGVMR